MKISDVEIIEFEVPVHSETSRWGYGIYLGEAVTRPASVSLLKISTDEGVDGYMLGGDRTIVEGVLKPLLVGENPLDREKIWHWMDQMITFSHRLSEQQAGVVDCALWDLFGRLTGLPVSKLLGRARERVKAYASTAPNLGGPEIYAEHVRSCKAQGYKAYKVHAYICWDLFGRLTGLPVSKLLGGARERVKAYASTAPNLGGPEIYAEHVRACKAQGYKAYKVHAYICWDPRTWQPAPQLPGFPREDVEICRAVREAAGDEMVLMHDPFGVYTLEESLWVGREIEKLGYYWLEHPMVETRIEAYRRLTRELDIAILAPEHVPGGPFARAEWLLQGASDMLRIDVNYGGITGCWKLINVCQAYGLKCELHGNGWPHLQLLGAAPEATCLYYERGLLRPGLDDPLAAPYLNSIPDPLDDDGNVIISQLPGLGLDLNWDYIEEHRVR